MYVEGTPRYLAQDDFNNDGVPDFAIALSMYSDDATVSTVVSVRLGNGDGTFGPAINQEAESRISAIAAGDFNNNGTVDLALTHYSDATVSILSGNGNGTFSAASSYNAITGARSIAREDFNNDGAFDLIVAGHSSDSV
jgi:hypothetical protein